MVRLISIFKSRFHLLTQAHAQVNQVILPLRWILKIPLNTMAARPHGTKGSESVKKQHVYPGLGRPLRINDSLSNYPNGATHDDGTQSELIYVRELAMMNVMDRLTDKAGWEKKVFDDVIVGKWKKEALAIPDVEFFKLASYGKLRWGGSNDENGGSEDKTVGIMNERTFEYVNPSLLNQM